MILQRWKQRVTKKNKEAWYKDAWYGIKNEIKEINVSGCDYEKDFMRILWDLIL